MLKENCKTVSFEGWEVDLFKCENKSTLGITVYEKGKTADDEDAKSVNLFVKKDKNEKYGEHMTFWGV